MTVKVRSPFLGIEVTPGEADYLRRFMREGVYGAHWCLACHRRLIAGYHPDACDCTRTLFELRMLGQGDGVVTRQAGT